MNYELFITLYSEALEYDNLDMYIAERGWQDWMDKHDPTTVLPKIYKLAHGTLKNNRTEFNLNRASFSRLFRIPLRTVENWETETDSRREVPQYTRVLIDYALFSSDLNDQ